MKCAAYVSLSRHHESVDIFWSREVFQKPQDLYETLGRDRQKDVAVDYLHPFKDLSYLKNRNQPLTEKQAKEQERQYKRLEERLKEWNKDRTPEQIREHVKATAEKMYREMGKPSPFEKEKKETMQEQTQTPETLQKDISLSHSHENKNLHHTIGQKAETDKNLEDSQKPSLSLGEKSRDNIPGTKNHSVPNGTQEGSKPKRNAKEVSIECIKYWNRLKEEALENPSLQEHHQKEAIHFASKFCQRKVLVNYCQKNHAEFAKEITEMAKQHKPPEQTKVITKTIEKDLEITL